MVAGTLMHGQMVPVLMTQEMSPRRGRDRLGDIARRFDATLLTLDGLGVVLTDGVKAVVFDRHGSMGIEGGFKLVGTHAHAGLLG